MSKKWLERPKSLSERSYRKYMAKQKKVTVNGMGYFDAQEDVKTPEKLIAAIEKFLRE